MSRVSILFLHSYNVSEAVKFCYADIVKKFFLILMGLIVLVVVGFFVLRYLDNNLGVNQAYFKRLLTYRNCYQTGYQKSKEDSELGIEGTLVNHGTYYSVEQHSPVSYRFTNITPENAIEKMMKERAGSLVDTKFVEHNFVIQNGVKIPDINFLIRNKESVHDATLLSICFK